MDVVLHQPPLPLTTSATPLFTGPAPQADALTQSQNFQKIPYSLDSKMLISVLHFSVSEVVKSHTISLRI